MYLSETSIQEKVNDEFPLLFQNHLFFSWSVSATRSQAIAKCWHTNCTQNEPISNHINGWKLVHRWENRPNTDLVKEWKLLQCSIFSHCCYWQIFGTSQFHFLLLKEQTVLLNTLSLKYYQIPFCGHVTTLSKGWNSVFPKEWSSIAMSSPPEQSLSNDSLSKEENTHKMDRFRKNSKEQFPCKNNELALSRANTLYIRSWYLVFNMVPHTLEHTLNNLFCCRRLVFLKELWIFSRI